MSDLFISCFSLNVRGIRELTKRKALFLFCKAQKKNIHFLQETHSNSKDESFWRNQWGGKMFFCHGSNRSGGVMILLDHNFNASVTECHTSTEGRWLIVVLQTGNSLFILANVYGFNNSILNNALFQGLSTKILLLKNKFPSASFIIGGDFNEAPDLF